MIKALFLLMLSLLISACGQHRYFDGLQDIPPEMTEIYIIRPAHFVGAANSLITQIDGEDIGYLRNGHYLNKLVKTGGHTIAVKPLSWYHSNVEIESVNIKEGERVYFIAEFTLDNYFDIKIKQVSEEEGLRELSEFAK